MQELTINIQPLESIIVNLTQMYKMIKNNNDIYNELIIDHKGLLRRNIIIYNNIPEIVSIDHI